MKTTLTIEESTRLIELGVDPKMASKCESTMKVCASGRGIIRLPESRPIFTLSDLLSILPKEIDGYCLNMSSYRTEWYTKYEKIESLGRRIILRVYEAPELIDALYQLLIWSLEQGFINSNTNKK